MTNCNASFSHRKQYITPINRVFGEKFQNMDEFKEENNFKDVLRKWTCPMGLWLLIGQGKSCREIKKMDILCINIKGISIIKRILHWLHGRQLRRY